MQTKLPVEDTILLLPGIMGSVLRGPNGDVWKISIEAVINAALTWRRRPERSLASTQRLPLSYPCLLHRFPKSVIGLLESELCGKDPPNQRLEGCAIFGNQWI